jgi:hypothetical protein
VAQGLLTRADEFARQFAASQNSLTWANVRAAQDHADGQAGVLALCIGFVLQAAGYVAQLGGASKAGTGTDAALVAVACVIVAVAVAWAVARATRWPRTRTYLVELARFDRWGKRHNDPAGQELMRYADILGRLPDDERYRPEEHCRRVWMVERVRSLTSPPS